MSKKNYYYLHDFQLLTRSTRRWSRAWRRFVLASRISWLQEREKRRYDQRCMKLVCDYLDKTSGRTDGLPRDYWVSHGKQF